MGAPKETEVKLLPLVLLLVAAPLSAASFTFDASTSELGFIGDYGGEPVPGKFKVFSGTVDFDLAKPLATRFSTEIDVASLDTDYSDRDDTLRGEEFFDTAKHPQASYASSGDCTAAGGKLSCPGTLTLRGVTKPVALEITPLADGRIIEGKATVDRSQFRVGSGDWADPESIAHAVTITFRLKLAP